VDSVGERVLGLILGDRSAQTGNWR